MNSLKPINVSVLLKICRIYTGDCDGTRTPGNGPAPGDKMDVRRFPSEAELHTL